MPYTSTTQPSHRKALNKDQLNVLYALYKFRFGTTDLLITTQSKQISRQYMNTRLRILCDQEYIDRRYDNSYKLQAKFAQYFLLPKGIEVLKQHLEHFNKQVLRNIKKDVDASDRFVRHTVNIFAVYARLREHYGEASGNSFHFYTKSYMVGDKTEGFPMPLPDGLASFRMVSDHRLKHYLIECFDDTMPQSVIRKKIERLVDHADADEWSLTSSYPVILLVCETERLRILVRQWSQQERNRSWSNNLVIDVVSLEEEKWDL
jgi:hypothetical protein